MFEDLIKEMGKIDGSSVSIPIETDELGYIDKQCPNEECEFLFKVNENDWQNNFGDDAVWCPLCRHEAPARSWYTIEQVEHAHAEAMSVVHGKIHNALRAGANDFNRGQNNGGLISMSMTVTGGPKRTFVIPAKAAESMQLEIQCESCESRFAVVGSAYFCPACGHNSVLRTFRDSLRKIEAKKDNVNVVRDALVNSVGKDEAELTCRSLIETCLNDGVMAFQRYCERMYEPYGEPPFNAFQRLSQSSDLWRSAVNKSFDMWLSESELQLLGVLYQKRHLLSHSEGIVDSTYIRKSGDKRYREGQRIIISEDEVEFLVSALERLANGIEDTCSNA